MKLNRRNFLKSSGAIIGATTAPLGFAVGAAEAINDEIFVHVFLRGGMDGLSLIPPIGGYDRANYENNRPRLKIPATGSGAALPLGGLGGTEFGLHPSAAPLKELYDSGHLAVIQAVGAQNSSRSHFDAMTSLELGTPGILSTTNGWLSRHLETTPHLSGNDLIPVLAVGSMAPTSLLDNSNTLAIRDLKNFNLSYGHWKWDKPGQGAFLDRHALLRQLYSGYDMESFSGGKALLIEDTINAIDSASGPVYPTDRFSKDLKVVAQLIKHDVGLKVATVDFANWDTHRGQNYSFTNQLTAPLAAGLAAFFNDIESSGNIAQRVTIVIQSEFGRKVKENASQGTDHGTGNVMLLLGRTVKGGNIYGNWPGLETDSLFEGEDLAVTTDYRQILSEILTKRLQNNNISAVFPGFQANSPLDVMYSKTG